MVAISTADLRKRLGEVFDRVQYGSETYVVERKGRAIGAIVPPRLLLALQAQQKDARGKLLRLLDVHAEVARELSDDDAMEIALAAQAEVRAKRTDPTTR